MPRMARIRQRPTEAIPGGGSAPAPAFNTIKKMAWYVPSGSAYTSLLAKFDQIVYHLPPLTASASTWNTQTAAVKAAAIAAGRETLVFNYCIAYETPHAGGQLYGVGTITRTVNGSTVTVRVTLKNRFGSTASRPSSMSVGSTFWIFQAGVSAYNGSWTITATGTDYVEFQPASNTSAYSAADDTTGQGLTCSDATVIRHLMTGTKGGSTPAYTVGGQACTGIKDNPSWFVWKVGTSGRRTFWGDFENYHMNLTQWASTDSRGDTYPTWQAKWYWGAHWSSLTGLDGAFIDNFIIPRDDKINDAQYGSANKPFMDWKRLGSQATWQRYDDADIIASHTQGTANFAEAIRVASGNTMILCGNADTASGDPAPSNLAGAAEQLYLELFMNIRSETLSSWYSTKFAARMASIPLAKARMKAHAKNVVWLHVTMAAKNNYAAVRSAVAMAMMNDGVGVTVVANDDTDVNSGSLFEYVPTYYDPYDIVMGTAIDPVQTAARGDGTWRREYSRAYPIINPTGTSKTVTVGSGWYFPTGTQDPTVDSGAAVGTTITVPAYTAYILVKP